MLLRLRIRGFKNLRDVEIRFGPLTCLVGPNGVGKSNVFDAIQFLRHLAGNEIQHAAELVRSPSVGGFGPRDLLFGMERRNEMRFDVDMIVPCAVEDDFGREASPAVTTLRYAVRLRYADSPRPRLELVEESLSQINKGQAKTAIGFPHGAAFRNSVVTVRGKGRRGGALIRMEPLDDSTDQIVLGQDGGSRGRPVPPGKSPRTVLGGTVSAVYPTVVAARREMSSWHALHLEPSSLRAPDRFGAPAAVSERGAHIAATLYRLSRESSDKGRVYADAANRLSRVVPAVRELRVVEDPVRQQFVVELRMHGSDVWLSPRALSDGTLRFLALVTMELDAGSSRVLSMEEPENGIHPSRVDEMVLLLRDYAVDPQFAVSDENPLRQVILNSHSPDVVRQLNAQEVLLVDGVLGPQGREARVRPVQTSSAWRRDSNAVSAEAVAEFIGGAPIAPGWVQGEQLKFRFGTAR